MSAVSSADPSSSSTPQEDAGEVQATSREAELDGIGEGGESKEQGDSGGVEVVEGGKGEGVPVIKPALVYSKKGDVVEVDHKVVDAVDGFRVPRGFMRKGSREKSFMYSLGVYAEERGGINHQYFRMADTECRRAKKTG